MKLFTGSKSRICIYFKQYNVSGSFLVSSVWLSETVLLIEQLFIYLHVYNTE